MANELTTGEQRLKEQKLALDELIGAEKGYRAAEKRLRDARTNVIALGVSEEDAAYFEGASRRGLL